MAVELKRNEKTGIVEAYEEGNKIGEVVTMGDQVGKEVDNEDSI